MVLYYSGGVSMDSVIYIVIIVLLICVLLKYMPKENENVTPQQTVESELTPKEKESISFIINNFEKEIKRKTTDKELAFIVFAVKSWRLHKNPSYMATLFLKEGQTSIDASAPILDISILMQWEKDYPEDYRKFKQR